MGYTIHEPLICYRKLLTIYIVDTISTFEVNFNHLQWGDDGRWT